MIKKLKFIYACLKEAKWRWFRLQRCNQCYEENGFLAFGAYAYQVEIFATPCTYKGHLYHVRFKDQLHKDTVTFENTGIADSYTVKCLRYDETPNKVYPATLELLHDFVLNLELNK
jgi:hypothetical protein